MKKIKLFLILTFTLLLVGCGLGANNVIEVDKNFNGRRDTTIFIPRTMILGIEGGVERLNTFFNDNVNEPLKLSYFEESLTGVEVGISMFFSNLDDYNSKLISLNGEVIRQASFDASSEVFTGSAFFDDANTSVFLKNILKKAIEEGILEDSNLSDIWAFEKYQFILDGETIYSSQSGIEFENTIYTGPKKIETFTQILSENQLERTYFVEVHQENLGKWANKIEEHPNIDSLELISGNLYKIVGSGTIEEIEYLNRLIFNTNESELNIEFNVNNEIEAKIFEKLSESLNKGLEIGRNAYSINQQMDSEITIEDFDKKDVVILDSIDLISGKELILNVPIKHNEVEYVTDFSSVNPKRKIIFRNFENSYSEFFYNYLKEKYSNINITRDIKNINSRYEEVIEVDYQLKPELDNIFFESNYTIENRSNFFFDTFKYLEKSKLRDISASKIIQTIILENKEDSVVNFDEENSNSDNIGMIVKRKWNYGNIGMLLIGIIGISAIFYIVRRGYKQSKTL